MLSSPAFSASEADLPESGIEQESAQVVEEAEVGTHADSDADASQAALEPEVSAEPVTESAQPDTEQAAAETATEETEAIIEETQLNAAAAIVADLPAVESTAEPLSDSTATGIQKAEENAPVVTDSNLNEVPQTSESASLKTMPASPPKELQVEFFVGASLMNFGYTEFAEDGAWLDEENGVLPGLLIGGSLHWSRLYASLAMNYHFGEVDYQGHTQSVNPALSGLPISSISDADIFDTTAIAGYQFSSVSVYGGVGYYFWRRNIRPTVTDSGLSVAGVLEFYSWSYALLGVKTELWRNWTSHIELDLRATRMLQANMEVDFLGFGGYDNARLNLGEDWGLRLAVPWTFPFSENNSSIVIEPFYTRWDLKRSSVTELTAGGVATGSGVVEPRSETRNFGISIYFRYLM